MSTFLAYWERCESRNTYIVGNINLICKHKDDIVWTGLRRYKIGKSIELTILTYLFVASISFQVDSQYCAYSLIKYSELYCNVFFVGFFYSDGVQKYNKCYIIETLQSKIGYKERDCREKHQFICKQDIGMETLFYVFF